MAFKKSASTTTGAAKRVVRATSTSAAKGMAAGSPKTTHPGQPTTYGSFGKKAC